MKTLSKSKGNVLTWIAVFFTALLILADALIENFWLNLLKYIASVFSILSATLDFFKQDVFIAEFEDGDWMPVDSGYEITLTKANHKFKGWLIVRTEIKTPSGYEECFVGCKTEADGTVKLHASTTFSGRVIIRG